MTTFWCEHAHLPSKVQWGVRLTVDDGRISAVRERVKPADGDVRLHGVVVPGIANAHSHTFHRALRGRTHAGGGNFWSWRDEMYAVARRLQPESYLALARAVFLEMLAAGYTAVGEFHYLHHQPGGRGYDEPNAMGEALVQAARDVGIRLTLLDTIYLHGGLTPQGHLPLDEVQIRFGDGTVDQWAERVTPFRDALGGDPLVRVGAAAHSVRALTPTELDAFGEVTDGWTLHAHVSEQPAENLAAQAFYGRTPTEILGSSGLLDESFTAVHATHLSERDLLLLSRSDARACICPTTERDLADGVGPTTDLRRRGVPLCVGSDQHAVIDPWEELRALEMHERLMSHERGRIDPAELVRIGATEGYRAIGWAEGGQLAVGALADFVVLREDSRRTAGSDPGQIVFSAGAPDVTDVVVAGQHLIRAGAHRLGEVDPFVSEALVLLREAR